MLACGTAGKVGKVEMVLSFESVFGGRGSWSISSPRRPILSSLPSSHTSGTPVSVCQFI
jgi:hypothetical protein